MPAPEAFPKEHDMDEQQGGRDDAEARRPGASDDREEGVLTLVCLTCGREYFFADSAPEASMSCEKCGSAVFRSFFSHTDDDEAAADFVESTQRDLDPDDPEGDVLPGDVLDLDRT
jgi:DNA-directed RNA polymerase subunit RPC12/RpoP